MMRGGQSVTMGRALPERQMWLSSPLLAFLVALGVVVWALFRRDCDDYWPQRPND